MLSKSPMLASLSAKTVAVQDARSCQLNVDAPVAELVSVKDSVFKRRRSTYPECHLRSSVLLLLIDEVLKEVVIRFPSLKATQLTEFF